MISFSKAKDMFRLQREAKKIKKELRNIHVEAEAHGSTALTTGGVKVVVSAEMEVISVTIAPEVPQGSIPALLIDALNRALKKAQVVSSQKMQGVMSEMGLTQ
ncbi:YbaB/EbfC family nucleoid-associated protein [Candidatus Peregrinibacteria bacterium]|nr:YbaB/EbfC family nucleoid-associated protein [Candidatus Peregrinibacteria bacterium]